MLYISQNFKKDCSEEPVETTKGKNIEMCARVQYYCSIPLKACLIVESFFNIAI